MKKTLRVLGIITVLAMMVLVFAGCDNGSGTGGCDCVLGSWVVTTAATCTTAGVETRHCTRAGCAEYETRAIAALGHDLTGNWRVTNRPTRTTAGEEARDCQREGCEGVAREIGAMTDFFFDMQWIPAGTFTMGSDGTEWNAQPAHEVTLTQGFFMGATEVTQLQWRQVMEGNENGISASPSGFTETRVGQNTDNFPVEGVSWYEILVFANRLSIESGLTPAYEIQCATNNQWTTDPDRWGAVPTTRNVTWDAVEVVAGSTGYRLPTEAQWEFAARAGTTTQWSFGDTADGAYMWFSQNSQSRTQEVGTRNANPWGLYDMHGNVWEWVWDWWGNYPSTAQTDPTGASSGSNRVSRGGSWGNTAEGTRSANRFSSLPFYRHGSGGFRLVRP